jgi:hypothetical protein
MDKCFFAQHIKFAKKKKTICFEIPNHQKWVENSQLGIISQTLDNLNLVHTWNNYKLKHNWLH